MNNYINIRQPLSKSTPDPKGRLRRTIACLNVTLFAVDEAFSFEDLHGGSIGAETGEESFRAIKMSPAEDGLVSNQLVNLL